jgi:hypothetical protein
LEVRLVARVVLRDDTAVPRRQSSQYSHSLELLSSGKQVVTCFESITVCLFGKHMVSARSDVRVGVCQWELQKPNVKDLGCRRKYPEVLEPG